MGPEQLEWGWGEVKSGEGFSAWGLSGWGEELRGVDGEGGWSETMPM